MFLTVLCSNLFDMEARVEQRSVLKFLVKGGATPMDCWRWLHEVYRGETFTPKTVRVWHKKFARGEESTKDKKRTGRPRSVRTAENIQKIQDALSDDRRVTLEELSQKVDVKPTTLHTIMKKDLQLSKLAPKFIPRILTPEQKRFRVELCQSNIQSLKEDPDLLKKVVTGDESWVSVFEMELKKDSKEWLPKGTHAERPLKAIRNRSTKKVMVTVFMDYKGPVLVQFKPPGESITADAYCETLKLLKERIRHKRPEKWTPRAPEQTFILHHDNALVHTAAKSLALIGMSNINMLPHPPYSPNLAVLDYWLFPRLKAELRGHRFQNLERITAVIQTLDWIPQEEYSQAIHSLPLRWMKCLQAQGEYFEGRHLEVDPADHDLEMFQVDSDEDEN